MRTRGIEHDDGPGARRLRGFGAARWAGLIAGPVLGLVVSGAMPQDVGHGARVTAGLTALMAAWWVLEVIPVAATALLPLVVLPLTGARTFEQAAGPFADRFIFLFMGGFMLALTLERWGLHRRFALTALAIAGPRPGAQVGALMAATALLSMWVSNTATAAMMLPIATSLAAVVSERHGAESSVRGRANFATSAMLGVAYAASIGGVATLIGTPPNALLAGYLETATGERVGFLQWMAFGAPLGAAMLFVAWVVLTRWMFPARLPPLEGGRTALRDHARALGPMSAGERGALVVFGATALAWVLRQPLTEWGWLLARAEWLSAVDDSMIALMAALALFALPVARDERGGRTTLLDWPHAVRLPWGVLMLFGGGLSLASAMRATGLDVWAGTHLHSLAGLPLVVVCAALAGVIVFMSEVASNTAVAAAFLPIAGAISLGMGEPAHALAVPAAVAASFAFMMPVGTPPNAIAYGTGLVRMRDMARAGLALNIAAVGLITAAALWLGPLVFGDGR